MPLSDRRKPTATAAIIEEAKQLLPAMGIDPAAEYAMSRGIPRFIAYKVLRAPQAQQRVAPRRKDAA
ncbi:UNVERIFIED_ORG: hypothetical protein JN05_01675 [Zoogloea ramigera]|uniref:Uncharacterized protein n=1 Tax=Duganella zoogloeoides TaxID=75659 RepID=A0ABZ0Y734_9BURK|nr:hypothetical protein [Duganella zoogloeoides]WQH07277.1 hypothetical protein SR858_13335 [Duganella zoogloeoides]